MDNATDLTATTPVGTGQVAPQSTAPTADQGVANTPNGSVVGADEQPTPTQGQPESVGFEIPDKFKGKSQEDIAKAYVELERHNKKVEMERADLEKLFISEPETPKQEPVSSATAQEQEDPLRQIMTQLAPELRGKMSKMLSPVIAKMELKDMVDRYGDEFISIAPKVADLKKQNPSLSLDAAFKIVAFDNTKRTAMNQGVAQAQKAQEQAQKAQLETARPSGYRVASVEDAVKDPNVSVSEIAEALGPEYKSFAEISKRRAGKN